MVSVSRDAATARQIKSRILQRKSDQDQMCKHLPRSLEDRGQPHILRRFFVTVQNKTPSSLLGPSRRRQRVPGLIRSWPLAPRPTNRLPKNTISYNERDRSRPGGTMWEPGASMLVLGCAQGRRLIVTYLIRVMNTVHSSWLLFFLGNSFKTAHFSARRSQGHAILSSEGHSDHFHGRNSAAMGYEWFQRAIESHHFMRIPNKKMSEIPSLLRSRARVHSSGAIFRRQNGDE